MLRIYSRLLAVVFALMGTVTVAVILGVGPGVDMLYLGSAGIVVYASSYRRDPEIVRVVVGVMGMFLLLLGLFLAFIMSVLGFPYEGRG